MAAPIIKKSKTSQKINLKEEFGIDFRGRDSLKQALGQAIIDRIVSRTESGQGMSFGFSGSGTPVKLKSPYSKAYAKSDDFKAFGKSRGNVNMTLTGDMLASIDLLKIDGNTIEVGINDSEEALKSYNHNTGDTVPKRPFFGVNKKELKEIRREFSSDIKEILDVQKREGKEAFEGAVLNLIGKIKDGG